SGAVSLPAMPSWDKEERRHSEVLPTLSATELVSLERPEPARAPAPHAPPPVELGSFDDVDPEPSPELRRALREKDEALTAVERLEKSVEGLERQVKELETREQQLLERCKELRAQHDTAGWGDSMRRMSARLSEALDPELFRPWYRKPAAVVGMAVVAAAVAAWIGFNAVGPLAL
ncbi:MAG: hypothetical protein AAFY60_10475, partial [Myxococcota bacterium]